MCFIINCHDMSLNNTYINSLNLIFAHLSLLQMHHYLVSSSTSRNAAIASLFAIKLASFVVGFIERQ